MAQTTASVNACDVVIEVQTLEGSMLDISGSSNAVTMDFSNEIGKRRTFGSKFTLKKACGKDATLDLKIIYTELDSEALNWLRDWYFNHEQETRIVDVYVPDKSEGSDKYHFTALVNTMNIPIDSEDAAPILVSGKLEASGIFTWSRVAS